MPVDHGAGAVVDGLVDRLVVDRLRDRLAQLHVLVAADPRVVDLEQPVVRAEDGDVERRAPGLLGLGSLGRRDVGVVALTGLERLERRVRVGEDLERDPI